jgi:hypothetical protein
LQTLRDFCQKHNFDISYLPKIKKTEVNRFNKLPEAIYYEAAKSIIDPKKQSSFFAAYPFNVGPASDDKPYFSNFFRWRALPHLIKTLGHQWLPFTEYGYLVLLATFIQALIVGGAIIILPLILLYKRNKLKIPLFKKRVWLYFIALGFSYMTWKWL